MTFIVVFKVLKCSVTKMKDLRNLLLIIMLKSKRLHLVLDVNFMTLSILDLIYIFLSYFLSS